MADHASPRATAVLALADGTLFHGEGYGATGQAAGGIHFDTSMTGYQEILSDPARRGRIVAFTFPHIGNTGAARARDQSEADGAAGIVTAFPPTAPSNWQAEEDFSAWLTRRGVIGIAGIDTRRLTLHLRDHGAQGAALAHDPAGEIDTEALLALARAAKPSAPQSAATRPAPAGTGPLVALIDLGLRRDLAAGLETLGARIAAFSTSATAGDIIAQAPAGIVLSDGPGAPDAVAAQALPLVRALLDRTQVPFFGTGLGHQLLALAAGARVEPLLPHGSHGANHPARDESGGNIRIVSTSHDNIVSPDGLPESLRVSETSRFDGSILGLEWRDRPVSSVQYRPGPAPDPAGPLARFMAQVRAGA